MVKSWKATGLILACTVLLASVIIGLPSLTRAQDNDCFNEYMVMDGDTLSGIARKYSVNVDELAEFNGISNPNRINIGDVLCLDGLVVALPGTPTPPASPVSTMTPAADITPGNTPTPMPSLTFTPAPPLSIFPSGNPGFTITVAGRTYTTDEQSFYTVQSGDRLYNIALAFGLYPDVLAAMNGITDPEKIFSGQRLYIPAPSPSQPVPSNAPALSLLPRLAGPGGTISVFGYNFPANTQVQLYMEKPSLGLKSAILKTVRTDNRGQFSTTVTLPANWQNGSALSTRTISIGGYVSDTVWGMNFFLNSAFIR